MAKIEELSGLRYGVWDWLWERCERTYVTRADGRQMYYGHFVLRPGLPEERCEVRFWAKHPKWAMRDIANSCKHPCTFADQVIN